MASITKSSGRLLWALSLLGLDRLAAFFNSSTPWDQPGNGEAELTTKAFDNLSARVRELIHPTLQAMLDAGDSILDRLFRSEPSSQQDADLPWPFPTSDLDSPGNPSAQFPPIQTETMARPQPFAHESPEAPPPAPSHKASVEPLSSPGAFGDSGDDSEWSPAPSLPDVADYFGGDP